ncbi:hypothetical protein [Anaplasma centrale]|nr:hypothetical protein [Anaplasma centrale]
MPGCCNNSGRNNDSTEEGGGGSYSRLRALPGQMRDSLLCGFSGASSFLIASASAIQSQIFLSTCRSSMEPGARRMHERNMRDALASMKASALPAAEMFILVPLLCALLHLFGNFSVALCLLICWGAMFAVCLFVRVTEIIKGCPRVESPMYGHGNPFPRVIPPQGSAIAMHESEASISSTLDDAPAGAANMSLPKTYALSVLFVPFRAVTLVSTLVLMAIALVCLVPRFFHDVYDVVKGCVGHGSSGHPRYTSQSAVTFPRVADTAREFYSLTKSALFDLAWVATLGITGVPSLMHGVTVEGMTSPPHVDISAAGVS